LTLRSEAAAVPFYSFSCDWSANPGIALPTTSPDPTLAKVAHSIVQHSACGAATTTAFTVTRGLPVRISAEDGVKIEALPMVIQRNNQAWRTFYFGYRLGLVQVTSQNTQVPLTFRPVSLLPPQYEGTVVEYRNTADFPGSPGGHFFYTADPAQQNTLDSGTYGQFLRTGRSFRAGGHVPTCRFYGSVHPGPNSHFFSASEADCNALKALQATPTPTAAQQWNYEGRSFNTTEPLDDGNGVRHCPENTRPVYRAYNNAYPPSGSKNPWDSNHRFAVHQADIDEMVAQHGWRDEGIALCEPHYLEWSRSTAGAAKISRLAHPRSTPVNGTDGARLRT